MSKGNINISSNKPLPVASHAEERFTLRNLLTERPAGSHFVVVAVLIFLFLVLFSFFSFAKLHRESARTDLETICYVFFF